MKSTILFSALAMVCLTSCNRYYYKPNAVNTPLFTDGGQAHLNVAGSSGDGDGAGSTRFFDLQASYSPIKYIGIIGNYSTYNFRPSNPDIIGGNVPAKARLIEAGIGGYYPVGERKVKMVVEMYAGGGGGNIESDVNMKVSKLFLQPGIGMQSPWVDIGFSVRASNIKYKDLDDNGRGVSYLYDKALIDYYNRRIDQGTYTFIEPCFTIRTGYKFAKAQFQGVLAHPTIEPQWRYNGARFTAGFYFSLEGLVETIREGNRKQSSTE